MWINTCEAFNVILKEIVKRDIPFTMCSNNFDGNIDIHIISENGNHVYISQYMCPVKFNEDTNKYDSVPVGLNIMHKTNLGNCEYYDGADVAEILKRILKFIEK